MIAKSIYHTIRTILQFQYRNLLFDILLYKIIEKYAVKIYTFILFYFLLFIDPKNVSIAKLQDLHWSLCNSIKIVNDKFGFQLLLQLFCNCVQLVVTPYYMIINLFYPVIYGSTDIKFILIQVVWVLTHLSHLLLIVLPTSYATRKVNMKYKFIIKPPIY